MILRHILYCYCNFYLFDFMWGLNSTCCKIIISLISKTHVFTTNESTFPNLKLTQLFTRHINIRYAINFRRILQKRCSMLLFIAYACLFFMNIFILTSSYVQMHIFQEDNLQLDIFTAPSQSTSMACPIASPINPRSISCNSIATN